MIYVLFTAPYEHSGGCRDSPFCYNGQRCIADDECNNCTFGECIQLAKQKNSAGFSYSAERKCKLCTNEKLDNLEEEKYWAVYSKKGKLRFPKVSS